MNPRNSIQLALQFYKQQPTTIPLHRLLLLVALSGVLETLPILGALPLLKSVFLANDMVSVGVLETTIFSYSLLLILLLFLRFYVGKSAQFANAKARINLITDFRLNAPEQQRKVQKVNYGKSVQAMNFLLVGWSQFIPGLLFTILGISLAPKFGAITLFIVSIWGLFIARIKRNQDAWHKKSSDLADKVDSLNTLEINRLQTYRIQAAKWDSINKNLREIVIISSLIGSLMINNFLGTASSFDSLFVVIVFLRGLQQLFTAYIMSQQLAGLRHFLTKVNT